MDKKEILACSGYVLTALMANLLVYHFAGTISFQLLGLTVFATPLLVGMIFIGFDLTCRDYIHENWRDKNLWPKMLALIGVGSILTATVNIRASWIAIASFVGFLSAGIVDTFVYGRLIDQGWKVKVNGSNVFASASDSFFFISIAFGFMPLLIFLQFVVKAFGGFAWSPLVGKLVERK